jgi:hypothetical protein
MRGLQAKKKEEEKRPHHICGIDAVCTGFIILSRQFVRTPLETSEWQDYSEPNRVTMVPLIVLFPLTFFRINYNNAVEGDVRRQIIWDRLSEWC